MSKEDKAKLVRRQLQQSRGKIMKDWTSIVTMELGRCGCILDVV